MSLVAFTSCFLQRKIFLLNQRRPPVATDTRKDCSEKSFYGMGSCAGLLPNEMPDFRYLNVLLQSAAVFRSDVQNEDANISWPVMVLTDLPSFQMAQKYI